MSSVHVEIPESSSPERWVRLQRPCENREAADELALRCLRPGMFYRIVRPDLKQPGLLETLCCSYVPESPAEVLAKRALARGPRDGDRLVQGEATVDKIVREHAEKPLVPPAELERIKKKWDRPDCDPKPCLPEAHYLCENHGASHERR